MELNKLEALLIFTTITHLLYIDKTQIITQELADLLNKLSAELTQ
jgi:hypothetical protein